MTNEQAAPPQPDPMTIIRVQKGEIDRLNDNRIMLLSMLEDIRNEANGEITRLIEENSSLKSRVPDDEYGEDHDSA